MLIMRNVSDNLPYVTVLESNFIGMMKSKTTDLE